MNKVTTKLRDDFYCFNEEGVRSFLLIGQTKCLLIDTGFGKLNLNSLIREITTLPISLFITHADPDHIGGICDFDNLYLHKADEDRLKSKMSNYHGKITYLEDSQILDFSPFSLEVIHIPGHTPGSVALIDKQNNFVIAGDSIQQGAVFMFGEGRELNTYLSSLNKINARLNSAVEIYASHGPVSVDKNTINELIEAVTLLKEHKLIAQNPPMPLPCSLYNHKRVHLLAN